MKVAASDDHMIAVPDAPCTLNVESVFSHFLCVTTKAFDRSAPTKLEPCQISSTT